MTRRGFFDLVFGAAAVVGFKTTFGFQPAPFFMDHDVVLGDLDEIVTTTLRNRHAVIHANLIRSNALFARLSRGNA